MGDVRLGHSAHFKRVISRNAGMLKPQLAQGRPGKHSTLCH
jgi:hypothetical protein